MTALNLRLPRTAPSKGARSRGRLARLAESQNTERIACSDEMSPKCGIAELGGRPGLANVPVWARRTAWALLGCQLVALLIYSTVEFQSFALGRDFGTHAQAWNAIAHGNFSPWVTLYNVPFWKNNGEFTFWPLALLYFVFPRAVDLLWMQDLFVVATEVVAYLWVCEVLARSGSILTQKQKAFVAIGACTAMLLNPWCYQTVAFDYHAQAMTALFALLAARSLWAGRNSQLAYWVPLTLLSAGLGGLAVSAIGVSGLLAGRSTRRMGLLLTLIGVSWFLVFGELGAISVSGNDLSYWYGYLVHKQGHIGTLDIVSGLVHHPTEAVRMAAGRWYLVVLLMIPSGIIGVIWPWATPMAIVVLGPSLVNRDIYFLLPHASFQTWPVIPFILVGSVSVVVKLAAARPHRFRASRIVVVAWSSALVTLGVFALPLVPKYWLAVPGSAKAQLGIIRAHLPAGPELVVSEGVIGRFSEEGEVYDFYSDRERFPVTRRTVLFILTPEGHGGASASQTEKGVRYAIGNLGAHLVLARGSVYELEWTPPHGLSQFELS